MFLKKVLWTVFILIFATTSFADGPCPAGQTTCGAPVMTSCPPGFGTLQNGVCIIGPTTTCMPGMILQGSGCILDPSIPVICMDGTIKSGNVCIPIQPTDCLNGMIKSVVNGIVYCAPSQDYECMAGTRKKVVNGITLCYPKPSAPTNLRVF